MHFQLNKKLTKHCASYRVLDFVLLKCIRHHFNLKASNHFTILGISVKFSASFAYSKTTFGVNSIFRGKMDQKILPRRLHFAWQVNSCIVALMSCGPHSTHSIPLPVFRAETTRKMHKWWKQSTNELVYIENMFVLTSVPAESAYHVFPETTLFSDNRNRSLFYFHTNQPATNRSTGCTNNIVESNNAQ